MGQVARMPAFGVAAVLTPLVLAGAVGASAPSINPPSRPFHTVAGSSSSPPPAAAVNAPGALRIPAMALAAYRNAESMMSAAFPACGVSWNLLAGIGRIESMHAYGGATESRGTAVRPIYGPTLDGTLPGNEIIVQSRSAGRVTHTRAMGPMQILPSTWSRYASDGDNDGKADVQNIFDASLAAARYLCSGGLNLRNQADVMAAVLRYNNSMAYARNVLSWAASYATGVVPVDLPPINGSVPTLGSNSGSFGSASPYLDLTQGIGPGLPLNATGLPPSDPLSLMLLMVRTDAASQISTNVPGFVPGQSLAPPAAPVDRPLLPPGPPMAPHPPVAESGAAPLTESATDSDAGTDKGAVIVAEATTPASDEDTGPETAAVAESVAEQDQKTATMASEPPVNNDESESAPDIDAEIAEIAEDAEEAELTALTSADDNASADQAATDSADGSSKLSEATTDAPTTGGGDTPSTDTDSSAASSGTDSAGGADSSAAG